jgi:transcriptional regulator with XRE-family HTH domain
MTQAAGKLGVNQSTIIKIEQDGQYAPFGFIRKSIEAYKIEDKGKQMEFFLSSLNSSEKMEIPLKEMNPLRKECQAALFTLGDVKKDNPGGWDSLLSWIDNLRARLKKPKFTIL